MAFKRMYSRSEAGTFPNSAEVRVNGHSTTSSSLITTPSRNVLYSPGSAWTLPIWTGYTAEAQLASTTLIHFQVVSWLRSYAL
jgi:hypothetical protein